MVFLLVLSLFTSASPQRATLTETSPREGPGSGELWLLEGALPLGEDISKKIGKPSPCKTVFLYAVSIFSRKASRLGTLPREKGPNRKLFVTEQLPSPPQQTKYTINGSRILVKTRNVGNGDK